MTSTRTDAEAPAGGEQVKQRSSRPPFVYHGHGDAHWRGQACHEVEQHAKTAAGVLVVFACGCRALVAPTSLDPMR